MWNCYDSAILFLICCWRMCVLLWWNPWCPWASVKECVPWVVTCVVCLRALLPACCNCTFYHWVFFFYVVCKVCIHIVRACWLRIETESVMEFLENIIYDSFLVLHWEHPDTEILCLILLSKLLTWKSKEWKCYLITVFLVILLCKLYCLIIKKWSICHLDCCFESRLMCKSLLCLEDVEWLCDKLLISNILFFSLSCHCCWVLRHHLRAVNDVNNKFVHPLFPPFACNLIYFLGAFFAQPFVLNLVYYSIMIMSMCNFDIF